MSLRFFSKSKTPIHVPPAGIAPPLHSKPVARNPLDAPASPAPATESDTLSVFLPEDAPAASPRALSTDGRQAPPRYAPAVVARDTRTSQMDAKRMDEIRRLFAQTQALLERLKGDSAALRTDLTELRSLGEHLGQGYTRLGDICRLTEKRSQLTVDVLDAIEKRIEPLEVVRDLSAAAEEGLASLTQLVDEIKQSGASFEAHKEAIGQGRAEATRVGQLLEELQARVTTVIEKREWLGEAEATVGRLEYRALQTTTQLDRRVNDFDAQKQTVEHALTEAMRVTAILNVLESRIAALAGGEQGLGYAETTIEDLEQRAAETTAQLERHVSEFDAERQVIEQAATEATRVTTMLSALEARVTALTGGDQGLGYAETTVGQLEQRATATMAELERRLGGFDGRKRAVEQALVAACARSDETLGRAEETVGWLEQRVAETNAQFERRVTHFDAQKQTIEQAVSAALAEGDRRLAHAQETVRGLAHKGAETAAQLERRVSDVDARGHAIEQALVAAMAAGDQRLELAEATVGRLEQRTASTTAELERRADEANTRLEQAVRARNDVERELERLSQQLQTLTESARNSVSVLRAAEPSSPSISKIRRPLMRWAAILGVLVTVELGIVMLLRRDQAPQIASTAPVALQEAPVAAPVSLLPSTASGLAMYGLPAGRVAATTGTMAKNQLSSTDRREALRPARTARTAVATQPVAPKETAQYVGVLDIDSEPAGGIVFVDQQRAGETPLQLTGLRAGSHVVRVERSGYDRWTAAVLVVADKQTRVSARLQALPVR